MKIFIAFFILVIAREPRCEQHRCCGIEDTNYDLHLTVLCAFLLQFLFCRP